MESFIKALLLQRILGIDSVALLRTILALSKELKDYCGFITIPDAPQFSRFKSEFEIYIEAFFEHLVDFTAPICRELDEKKSQYLIYDTTGIEACVKENNDKFFNTLLKQAKAMAKGNPNCDPYKLVYALFPILPKKLSTQNTNMSMVIFAMPTRQGSSPTVWESLDIFRFLTMISGKNTPR